MIITATTNPGDEIGVNPSGSVTTAVGLATLGIAIAAATVHRGGKAVLWKTPVG